jgi:hypothetical protein
MNLVANLVTAGLLQDPGPVKHNRQQFLCMQSSIWQGNSQAYHQENQVRQISPHRFLYPPPPPASDFHWLRLWAAATTQRVGRDQGAGACGVDSQVQTSVIQLERTHDDGSGPISSSKSSSSSVSAQLVTAGLSWPEKRCCCKIWALQPR